MVTVTVTVMVMAMVMVMVRVVVMDMDMNTVMDTELTVTNLKAMRQMDIQSKA